MITFSAPLIGEVRLYDLIAIAVIMAISVVVAKLVTNHLKKRLSDRMGKDELAMLVRITYYGIIIIGIFVALPYFRVDLSGLLVAGGVAGVIIGFASQSVVSNLVSGLFIIVERPVKIGDNISIGDVNGTVEEIHVLSTTVIASDGTYIRIPNEKVFTSNITNFVTHAARRVEYTVGIDYADDAGKGVVVIRELLARHPFVLRYPRPQLFVRELSPDAMTISILFWTPSSEYGDVRNEMLLRVKLALEDAGLSFPGPRRLVRYAAGERTPVGLSSGTSQAAPGTEDR